MKRSDYWIIKLILNENRKQIEFYVLFFDLENDKPLIFDDKLLLFEENSIIKLLNETENLIGTNNLTENIDLIYDNRKILDLINHCSIDMEAILVDSINILLDIANSMLIEIPLNFKEPIFSFADHMTFYRRYGKFLEANQISRKTLKDFFHWFENIILNNSMIAAYEELHNFR